MFQLVIFGGEYDAVKLSTQAYLLGWQVILVTTPFDGYTTSNFPGSSKVLHATADQLPKDLIDENTAIVMMTHNYSKDLSYCGTKNKLHYSPSDSVITLLLCR